MKNWKKWYKSLRKPLWTPDGRTITGIWLVIYPIIALSFVYVLHETIRDRMPWEVLAIYSANLVVNLLFTRIQFEMRNLPLASLDIFIIWLTIIGEIIFSWPYSRILAIAQLPYFIWVSTAMVLQFSITWLNRDRL